MICKVFKRLKQIHEQEKHSWSPSNDEAFKESTEALRPIAKVTTELPRSHGSDAIFAIGVLGVLQKRKNEGIVLFVVSETWGALRLSTLEEVRSLPMWDACSCYIRQKETRRNFSETSAVWLWYMIWPIRSRFTSPVNSSVSPPFFTLNEPITNGSRHFFYWVEEPETCDKRNFSRSR